MVVSCLPTWPLVLFGVIEPMLLVWAYVTALSDPFTFFADQAPNHALRSTDFSPQALAMTLQEANVMLLLAAIGAICCFTTTVQIARWYLVAVALADCGHIYATYRAVGPAYFWDITGWNSMIAGNVGVSVFLHVNRWLTVSGAFGALGAADHVKKNV